MAKSQYRISTDSNGTSNYGYAYVALVNPSGSGRKLTVRSLEVFIHSVMNTTTAIGATPCTLVRCSAPLDGEDMVKNAAALDSSVAIPSTCVVRRNSMPSAGTVLSRIDVARRSGAAANLNRPLLGSAMTVGKRGRRMLSGQGNGASGGYNNEPITLRQNEAVALVMDGKVESSTNPMRINVVVSINGKTAVWEFNANPYPGLAMFSVENSSSNPMYLLSFGVMDLGSTDTPTLRVVPIGQMYSPDVTDTSKQAVSVIKMDSTYPVFPGKMYSDIGFIPQGVPEVEISPASAGTPAGVNYLHTRDFWGPMYRNMLVEVCHMKGVGSAIPDTFGYSYSHKRSDLLCRRAGITLHPGEGLAVVNSAETMVGVQPAYGAWNPMTFSMQVDNEPDQVPAIAGTGLIVGSRWRVERVSDGSEVTGGVTGDGTFSYTYTTEDTPVDLRLKVRKSTGSPYYKNVDIPFTLTSAGVSIPVSQQSDE